MELPSLSPPTSPRMSPKGSPRAMHREPLSIKSRSAPNLLDVSGSPGSQSGTSSPKSLSNASIQINGKIPSATNSATNSPKLTPKNSMKKIRATSIHDAAFNGDLDHLREYISEGRDVNAQSKTEQTTPLHEAALTDQVEAAKLLIDSGADVNSTDTEDSTPLQSAAFSGSLMTMKLLVSEGAKLTTKDKEGSTPLHKASYRGHLKAVQFLLRSCREKERVAFINMTDDYGATALHHAALRGHPESAKYLIEKGASVNAEEKDGSTPLFKAVFGGQTECARILLEAGADVNAKDKQGATALHHASEQGHAELVSLLLSKNAKLDLEDYSNQTPLHNAAYGGHANCVQLLLEKGASPNCSARITSALHHAAFSGFEKCVAALLEKGANPNATDVEGSTPTHKAAFNGHHTCVKLLLDKGANIKAKDDEGSTPLHVAAFSGSTESVKLLLEAGADIKAPDNDEGTPLHNAASNGHIECLKALIDAGADPNSEDQAGSTPLHYAVRKGNKSCASYLIKHGATVNVQNDQLIAPLHYSVKFPPCVSLLLKHAAKVDLKDANGRTPLFYAVRNNIEESARMLIFRGADVNMTDKKGKSPLEISKLLTKQILLQIVKEKSQNEQAEAHKGYKVAVRNFNAHPKKGIEYLIEAKIVPNNPTSIAKFLHTAEGLNKNQIGVYLGENDKFTLDVLAAFVNYMDFKTFEVDHALRYFLSKFRLPGEAQKIDRIMEVFAAKFCSDNPSVFNNQDAAYLLAFSIIMLNTDAHNPNIKKENKMTKEQFIKNNRGINAGSDLPVEYMEKIYNRIVNEEIKMDTEGGISIITNAEMKGYLVKQGGRIKTWKKRWFVLSDNCLYYFKTHEDKEPIGIVPLENLAVRIVEGKRKFAFEIYHPEQDNDLKACKFDSSGAVVQGHHDSYIIACASQEELQEWTKAIEGSVFKNPFLELIRKKLAKQRATKIPARPISETGKKGALASEFKINFKELYELAQMCNIVLEEREVIASKYGTSTITETIGTKYKYYSTVNNDSKSQYVVLGSSTWDSNKRLKKDFLFWRHPPANGTMKTPQGHYKLADCAEEIYAVLRQQLKKDYNTVITGHSLFSAVCLPLASLLEQKGYKIKIVVTFGQPKVDVKDAIPDRAVIRVTDPRDPVSTLFPGCVSFGQEVVLLTGKYHTSPDPLKDDKDDYDEANLDANLACHGMDYYIRRIQPKVKESILISYSERHKYKEELEEVAPVSV